MRNETIKGIKLFNQSSAWNSDSKNYTKLAFKLDHKRYDNESIGKISFEKICGPDPQFQSFVDIILNDFDILADIRKYIEYKRLDSFTVKTRKGMSGCIDAKLITFSNKFSVPTSKGFVRAELHISCWNKINLEAIQNMWIGDLVELLSELDSEFIHKLGFALINNSKSGIRYNRRNLFCYIKYEAPKEKISLKDLLEDGEINNRKRFQFMGDNKTYIYRKTGYGKEYRVSLV